MAQYNVSYVTYNDSSSTNTITVNTADFKRINTYKPKKKVTMYPTLQIRQFDQPFPELDDYGGNEVDLFGGKGANLRRMTQVLGLPVPEGFTVPTTWMQRYRYDMKPYFDEAIRKLEKTTGRTFGGSSEPLFVSVRSGAPRSMPGMMETILNVGLNDDTVHALLAETTPEFAYDSYRRFVQMFATTVLLIDNSKFTDLYNLMVDFNGGPDLDVEMYVTLIDQYKTLIYDTTGTQIPDDPYEQAWRASEAVFRSWDSSKANAYREIEGIPYGIGTAVNVQRMVFGNLNENSGTGVVFTRNPNSGENIPFGDFLVNAQGEDVVAGTHATMPLEAMAGSFPEQYNELVDIMQVLENEYKDMCDIEFTIEDGKLYILQTRAGKRSANATVKIALDMFEAGIIDKDTAAERLITIKGTGSKSHNGVFDGTLIGSGLGAAGEIVTGKVVFTIEAAIDAEAKGEEVILVREQTSPEDIAGMAASVGILTQLGGSSSHAAVVARGWNKTCVVGVELMNIYSNYFTLGGKTVNAGDEIMINGETGEVFA